MYAVSNPSPFQIIDFIYTGQSELDDPETLLTASSYLLIEDLCAMCAEKLAQNVSIENCARMMLLGNIHERKGLRDSAEDFAARNFEGFLRHESFGRDLSLEDLRLLLGRDDLRVDGEESVFTALETWLKKNEERVCGSERLWESVRFSLLSPTFLSSDVASSQFFTEIVASESFSRALDGRSEKERDVERGKGTLRRSRNS